MLPRFTLLLVLALALVLGGPALTANAQTSAASAASAAPAKSAEKSHSVFDHEPPFNLGEKIVEKDETVVEKFLVHSAAMDRNIHVSVTLPPAYATEPEKKFPVLYTLHCLHGAYDTFSRMIPLHAAIKDKPMLVVGFDGDVDGFYLDSSVRRNSQFETFFFKELIPYIEKNYRALAEAKSRGVTGTSMGGYGAFHYVSVHPEMFASASSLSGSFRIKSWLPFLLGKPEQNQAGYDHADILLCLETAQANGVKIPPLYLTCGTEDGAIVKSRDLRDWLTEKKITVEYVEKAGAHNFAFWRDSSADIIDFHWRTFQGNYKPMEHPAPAPKSTQAAESASSAASAKAAEAAK